MDNAANNESNNIKLEIVFPKSDQDHRLQIVKVNNAIFAIVFAPLESNGPINLNCDEWSLILLAPIKSKKTVNISAVNLVCLSSIESEEEGINLHAKKRLIKFGPLLKPEDKVNEVVEGVACQLEDQAGALIYYHRVLQDLIKEIRADETEGFIKAQKDLMIALCSIAEKIEGSADNLDLQKVLDIWGIENLSDNSV